MIKEQINHLIKSLEYVREKPKLFIGVELDGMVHFLNGFELATGILDLDAPIDFTQYFENVIVERGWEITASLRHELVEKGLDENLMMYELITIHIETWRKILTDLSKD